MGSISLQGSKILAVWGLLLGILAGAVHSGKVQSCPRGSVTDSILGAWKSYCPLHDHESIRSRFAAVTEGNERWLQMAQEMIQENKINYVALLFYASWCPFSRSIRSSFDVISSLYPSIPHFAVEESSVRPSILSKYGVHGFPTLFLLNSTIRVRYWGPRTLDSLVAFYSGVTASLEQASLDKIQQLHHSAKQGPEHEPCPFTWAHSPEHMLRQETYLALATIFVLCRLIYFFLPTLFQFLQLISKRLGQNVLWESLLGRPLACLKGIGLLFSPFKQPWKRSNLQEGAMNARAWASKSLVTVSIGDSGSSRGAPAYL